MHKNNITVIDTETTGLEPEKGDRIIEIACIRIKNDKIDNNFFHTYLNVNKKISKKAYTIHRIKKKFLKDKPKFEDIFEKLDKFIKNSIIIAHNAKFDLKFLKMEYLKIGIKKRFKFIDTLYIAKKIFPGKKNSLKKISKRLKINYKKMHNALNDAKILAKVYLKLKNKQKQIL